MAKLVIQDLELNTELDNAAMQTVFGGWRAFSMSKARYGVLRSTAPASISYAPPTTLSLMDNFALQQATAGMTQSETLASGVQKKRDDANKGIVGQVG